MHRMKTKPGVPPPFDPAMMVCLLLYAYCVGVFSSRKIALACERNLAFLAIVGTERPDFRTISDFRKLHLDAFADVFVQVLRIAGEAGMVKLGNLATDGTKIQGNASRHQAMSYGYMHKEADRLREAIETLVTQAHQQDTADDVLALGSRRGDELPVELARQEKRLATIEAAMQRLEARAKADAEAERQRRAEAEAERRHQGTKRRGKAPKAVDATPDDKAQTNFTDPELRIMQTNNKGWDYCGNAQVKRARMQPTRSSWPVTSRRQRTTSSKRRPWHSCRGRTWRMPVLRHPRMPLVWHRSSRPRTTAAITARQQPLAVEQMGFDPYMATDRQRHHAPEGEASSPPATAKDRMAAKVRTPAGRALYARRKVIVEPVFGQIKEARGFRRFLLRSLAKIRGEWRLVCLTHNLLKIWRHEYALSTV